MVPPPRGQGRHLCTAHPEVLWAHHPPSWLQVPSQPRLGKGGSCPWSGRRASDTGTGWCPRVRDPAPRRGWGVTTGGRLCKPVPHAHLPFSYQLSLTQNAKDNNMKNVGTSTTEPSTLSAVALRTRDPQQGSGCLPPKGTWLWGCYVLKDVSSNTTLLTTLWGQFPVGDVLWDISPSALGRQPGGQGSSCPWPYPKGQNGTTPRNTPPSSWDHPYSALPLGSNWRMVERPKWWLRLNILIFLKNWSLWQRKQC